MDSCFPMEVDDIQRRWSRLSKNPPRNIPPNIQLPRTTLRDLRSAIYVPSHGSSEIRAGTCCAAVAMHACSAVYPNSAFARLRTAQPSDHGSLATTTSRPGGSRCSMHILASTKLPSLSKMSAVFSRWLRSQSYEFLAPSQRGMASHFR